jgi:hypothetical protein
LDRVDSQEVEHVLVGKHAEHMELALVSSLDKIVGTASETADREEMDFAYAELKEERELECVEQAVLEPV